MHTVAIVSQKARAGTSVRDIAWKAQLRLCAGHRRMTRAGKPANVVNVAIARELAVFVRAIATSAAQPA